MKLSSEIPKDAQKLNPLCVSMQISVQKTSVEKNQFPQIGDLEMNKPLNSVVTAKFNENNSGEGLKDARNKTLQKINKSFLVEKMSLDKSSYICENNNVDHEFSIVSNEDKTVTTDVPTSCRSIPNHSDIPSPEFTASVKENEHVFQASNNSKMSNEISENNQKDTQNKMNLIKDKYGSTCENNKFGSEKQQKNQFPQIGDVEMNKPLNSVVTEKFNENKSSEGQKDVKNNVLESLNKTYLGEGMSLENSIEICEKENDEYRFSVVSNEGNTIPSEVWEKNTSKSIPKHDTKPLLDYNNSVSENVHISQVINNSNISKENSENVQKHKQYELYLIKHKYRRLTKYFCYCNESLIDYFKILNKV